MSNGSDPIKFYLRALLILLSLPLGMYSRASASYLTIEGPLEISATLKDSVLVVSGSYRLKNSGDETAHNVFPILEFGNKQWVGSTQTLDQSTDYTWTFSEEIPISEFSCLKTSDCADLNLPDKGMFPVTIKRFYEDANGYKFSSIAIGKLLVSGEDIKGQLISKSQELISKVAVTGTGQSFTGTLTIKNNTTKPKRVALSLVIPRELENQTLPQSIEIDALGTTETTFKIKNFAGLDGSSYTAIALMQWEDEGYRITSTASFTITLKRESKLGFSIILGLLATLAIAGLLYFGVFRNKTVKA